MRKTKIVCTIGPACADEETLTGLCQAGMNVARLNFSHGTHEEHRQKIELIKRVREKLGLPIAIMLDTKGPEYRIRTFKNGKIEVREGDTFTFTTRQEEGDEHHVSVSYAGLANDLQRGDRVLVNNGLLIFEVQKTTDTDVICKVLAGGEMSDRKSMSFPNKVLKQTFLSEQDKADLLFGIQQDVDFIACSFVSCRQDLLDMRAFLEANGATDIELIAKIENQSGIDNIEEICQECSGIMIGRGDMGVEIPFEELPAIQKHLITKCRLLGKRVITATEMLESMIHNPRPTRAEISDVANAVYDGSSAIMLSGETAAGQYPVEAVQAMSRIAVRTEADIDYEKRFRNTDFHLYHYNDAMSHGACALAIDTKVSAIVVCTLSGDMARQVSRFRCPKPIIGMTTKRKVWNQLSLFWNVRPAMSEQFPTVDVLLYHARKVAKKSGLVKIGDRIIITAGITNGTSGNTDLIKMEEI